MALRFLKKPLLFTAYLILLIFIAEVILKLFFPLEPINIDNEPPLKYKLSNNKDIVYELRPNFGDNNLDGLRDREHKIKKEPNVTRIIIVGDSIAYGSEVSLEETYARKLEYLLNAGGGKKYEVLNLGVPGYDTVKILHYFKKKGLKYKPDILIYGFWFNDFHRFGGALFEYPFFIKQNARVWEAYAVIVSKFPPAKILRNLLFKSQLFVRGARLYYSIKTKNLPANKYPSEKEIPNNPQGYKWHYKYNKCFLDLRARNLDISFFNIPINQREFLLFWEALNELIILCREHSIRFLLLSTPVLSDFKEYKYACLRDFLDEAAQELKIERVCTFEDFAKAGYKNVILNDGDNCHPNPLGHTIIAETIAKQKKGSEKKGSE